MALVVKDRVRETSTTSGTGTLTLNGAVTGFQTFAAVGDGNTTYYTIVDAATGTWEVGIGTYVTAGPTLSRDEVLESSNSGNLVNFTGNPKDVFVTYPAERAVTTTEAATLTNKTLSTGTAITAGTINNAAIGGTTPSTGAFTTLASSSTTTLNGTTIPASKTLAVTTDKLNVFAATTSSELAGVISDETGSGALVFGTSPTLGTPTITTPAISGGTINNTVIGGTTRAAGSFTTLDANGNTTLGDANTDTVTFNARAASNLVPSTTNTRDLGATSLVWANVYATAFTEATFPVVSQTDVGTAPNQIPLNQYLGSLAFQNAESVNLDVTGGTINNASIGATTASTGAFTTLNASGNVLVGSSTAVNITTGGALSIQNTSGDVLSLNRYSNNASSVNLILAKSRGGSVGTNTIVQDGDSIGQIFFVGANGSGFSNAASITAKVDGVPGASNDMPGRLEFYTTPDGSGTLTERARITSGGNVGIGTSSPSATLDVNGPANSEYLRVGGQAGTNARGLRFSSSISVGNSGAAHTINAPDTYGQIIFQTVSTERLRIPSTGGLQCVNSISVGNAAPTTSGAGITFPATQSASTDANTLDDYEEGTFTPAFANLTVGDGSVFGRYTKIGRIVHLTLGFVFGSTSSISGTIGNITGLPFTSANISSNAYPLIVGSVFKTGVGWFDIVSHVSNSNTLWISTTTFAAAGISATVPTTFASGTTLTLAVTYEVV